MVQPERRVTRADKGVTAGIASDGEVATTVNTKLTGDQSWITLHHSLKVAHVLRVQHERSGVVEVAIPRQHSGVQIASQAPIVVSHRISGGGRVSIAIVRHRNGAETHGEIVKGACGDAAGAGSRWGGYDCGRDGLGHHKASVGNVGSIAAEGSRGAIEDGRFGHVVDVQAPFPVGQDAGIAAGVKAVFVFLDVPSVPDEESALQAGVRPFPGNEKGR